MIRPLTHTHMKKTYGNNHRARWAWPLPAVAIALLLITGCGGESIPEADAHAFTLSDTMMARIRLDTVRTQPVLHNVELNARIAPDDGRLANVYPIVGGQVSDVKVELGDRVKKGQTLAVIRSTEVAKFHRKLIDAQSDVEVAEKDLATKEDLYRAKLLSERKYVKAQYDLEKARAKLKGMEETFSIYRFEEGSQYVVTAPISGYIIHKDLVTNETLPEDHSDPLFAIAELDQVWVLAQVYESDIARVREGMRAEVTTLSYPDKVFTGRVDKISNVLDPVTRTMHIRINMPNTDELLKPEMIAHVSLTYGEDRELPAIPAQAVVADHGRQYVMVFKDRKNIETRPIAVDREYQGTAWVSHGLEPGEVIISKEQLYIYDALNDR